MNTHRLPDRRATFLLTALLLTTSRLAAAAPTEAERRIDAEAIFKRAIEFLDAKDYGHACPMLEEVVALQPQGVGAKLRLADCYIGAGKLASAYAILEEAASLAAAASQVDRATDASNSAKALESRLSRLTIVVGPSASSIPGLVVTRDGSALSPSLFNVPIALDGGLHIVRATAPGYAPFERSVEVPSEGGAPTLELVLTPAGTEAAADPPVPDLTGATAHEDRAPAKEEGARSGAIAPARVAGIVVGAGGFVLGAIGIGVGVAGFIAANDAAAAYAAAPDKASAAKHESEYSAANDQATAGWVVAGLGGAAAVTGIILIAASPNKAPGGSSAGLTVDAWAGQHGAGLSFRGVW